MAKTYFIPNAEHMDIWFGSAYPVCMDLAEVSRLASDWGMELDEATDQLHKASDAEIAEYGVYDSYLDPDIVALAERIRASDIWILADVKELCIAAYMESEWESADGDTFEYVAQEAADRLGVEII